MEQVGAAVEEPDVPEAGEHVWAWFWELDAGRSSNGFGANPIGYPDIAYWSALTDARPSFDEARMLRAMDATMLRELAKKRD